MSRDSTRPKFQGAPTADKSLGQHFLVNAGVVEKIGAWAKSLAGPKSRVLEVGPGPGILTETLLKIFPEVTVLEIDARMKAHLEDRFAAEIAAGSLKIVHEDALKIQSLSQLGFSDSDDVICVGNLPYNVGTRILFNFLEAFPNMSGFCVMLQKEVVDRLKAVVGDDAYGIPSIKCALLCKNFETFLVSPGSFKPPPKVDSAVTRFRRRAPANEFETELRADPKKFAEFFARIGVAFSKRRKMLKSSFAALKTEEVGTQRPEELTLQDWLNLYFSKMLN
jgi:16S rRNA (adenine1518-N6/adenine1519-N6)-dimethyltransferase